MLASFSYDWPQKFEGFSCRYFAHSKNMPNKPLTELSLTLKQPKKASHAVASSPESHWIQRRMTVYCSEQKTSVMQSSD